MRGRKEELAWGSTIICVFCYRGMRFFGKQARRKARIDHSNAHMSKTFLSWLIYLRKKDVRGGLGGPYASQNTRRKPDGAQWRRPPLFLLGRTMFWDPHHMQAGVGLLCSLGARDWQALCSCLCAAICSRQGPRSPTFDLLQQAQLTIILAQPHPTPMHTPYRQPQRPRRRQQRLARRTRTR